MEKEEKEQKIANDINSLRRELRPFDEDGVIPELQEIKQISFPENPKIAQSAKTLHNRYVLDSFIQMLEPQADI